MEENTNSQQENKLYVGNLPYSVTSEELKSMFSEVEGVEVTDAVVITDKFNNNRSRGYGFVTVAAPEMMQMAIDAMNGKDTGGRPLTVNVARPKGEGDRSDRSERRAA